MTNRAFIMIAALILFSGCKKEVKSDNPFFNKWETPFDNTIKMLAYSGDLLNKGGRVFCSLNSANTNDSLQAINREIAPLAFRGKEPGIDALLINRGLKTES